MIVQADVKAGGPVSDIYITRVPIIVAESDTERELSLSQCLPVVDSKETCGPTLWATGSY